MATRVQRTRIKGWRKPENAVIVTRGSRWGNPFVIGEDANDNAHVVALFRDWLEYDSASALDPYGSTEYRQRMSDRREWMLAHADHLRGRDLACWCPLDQPCHADVLLELAATGGGQT